MSDSTLYSAGGGLECLGDLGIQYLGDGVDHIHVVDGDDDGFPQVLVAFDVGRNAYFMDDTGDNAFDTGLVRAATISAQNAKTLCCVEICCWKTEKKNTPDLRVKPTRSIRSVFLFAANG